ncbi:MAG TPA: hypothetical protein VG889_13740 [Rhizomicrobium sp.]|nr:hypothetical protein [Rhizomicrobium sp.]
MNEMCGRDLKAEAEVVPVGHFALLPDTGHGATKLALRIVEDVFGPGQEKLYEAFDNLLTAFALEKEHVYLVVIAPPRRLNDVHAWLTRLGFESDHFKLIGLRNGDFTDQDWPRDVLLCATADDGAPVAIETLHERVGNLGGWIGGKLGMKKVQNKTLLIDGGDSLVVDDRNWILGTGSLAQMVDYDQRPQMWQAALDEIERKIGRRPIPVGSFPVGNLLYRERLALARLQVHRTARTGFNIAARSSLWARVQDHLVAFYEFAKSVATKRSHDDIDAMDWAHADVVVSVTGRNFGNGPVVLVGDPKADGCPGSDTADAMAKILKKVADDLTGRGFDVRRNPLPFCDGNILGYNNLIVQTDPDIVWLPTFGSDIAAMQAIDDENYRIWNQDLRFPTVHRVEGMLAFAENSGCIHCATLALPPSTQI